MRFLLDVDGVVANLIKYILDDLKLYFDEVPEEKDITDFHLEKFLSDNQYKHMLNLLKKEGIAQELPLILNAQDGVKAILDAGHEIHWITSRWKPSRTWVYDRDQWLMKHFNADPNFIVSMHHKYITSGDVFIDDRIENVEQWVQENPNGQAFLFKSPWNIKATHLESLNSWNEIDKILKNLE